MISGVKYLMKYLIFFVNDFVVYIDMVTHNITDAMYVTEKMDSYASSSMSGDVTRIVTELPLDTDVRIIGFNGTTSSPAGVGLNSDGKKEFFVPSMPKNLALLSAHSYAVDGAVVLLGDGGVVLQLPPPNLNVLSTVLANIEKLKNCVLITELMRYVQKMIRLLQQKIFVITLLVQKVLT